MCKGIAPVDGIDGYYEFCSIRYWIESQRYVKTVQQITGIYIWSKSKKKTGYSYIP